MFSFKLLRNNKIGNLQNGSYANFTITSGDIFETTTSVYEHWIRGSRTVFGDLNSKDVRGSYTFNFDKSEYKLDISGKKEAPKAVVKSIQ